MVNLGEGQEVDRLVKNAQGRRLFGQVRKTTHNVHFVKYDVTVSFMAQVLDTVAYFVSHVIVVDTVTYFDIFW